MPRVGGLVLDLMEEKNFLALMGHMSDLFCSHCRVRRVNSCDSGARDAPRQSVVKTLEAQFFAAQIRLRDSRASLRTPLARAHSALPLVLILGAMHGLSTGDHNYFKVVSFYTYGSWVCIE